MIVRKVTGEYKEFLGSFNTFIILYLHTGACSFSHTEGRPVEGRAKLIMGIVCMSGTTKRERGASTVLPLYKGQCKSFSHAERKGGGRAASFEVKF